MSEVDQCTYLAVRRSDLVLILKGPDSEHHLQLTGQMAMELARELLDTVLDLHGRARERQQAEDEFKSL